MNEVQMDYEAVEQAANGFDGASAVFKGLSTALEAVMTLLQTTAFIGLVGGAAVQNYLANIKPIVDKLALECETTSTGLRGAIQDRRGAEDNTVPDFN